MSAGTVLIIDDDDALRFALGKALRRHGYDVSEARSGEEALVSLTRESPPDAAILDLRMQGMSGIDVLRRRGASATRIIVLTGHGSVQAAVEAMRLGAFSFLEKPVDADVLKPLIAQAISETRAHAGASDFAPPIIGASAAIEEVRHFVATVGKAEETVAIYGETGTGKEVVARQLHLASPRSDQPFIALNAACVPRELFESELFGHRRGAFTGATGDRAGLFRDADGGTLFIDELAELPVESQAKLLRTLEAHTIRGIGDTKETSVDVRIIAATNRDLWSEVQVGRFREDLYFRLQVFPIVVPPLRSRREDIMPLAHHLLGRIGSKCRSLDVEAEHALVSYDWPGNVRELLNVLRRASLFAEGEVIPGDLARRMVAASVFAHPSATSPVVSPSRAPSGEHRMSSSNLADVERSHIEQVLAEMGGNVTRAAVALGIDRRTLQRKLRSYGITGDE